MNDAAFWVEPDGTAHERCRLVFISTGEGIEFDPGAHPELRWQRESVAYFCAYCGDVWERIILIDSRGQSRPFEVFNVSCSKHHSSHDVPGSRLHGHLEGLLPLLPLGILGLEFNAHLQQAEGELLGINSRGASQSSV